MDEQRRIIPEVDMRWPDGRVYQIGGEPVEPPVEGEERTARQLAVEAMILAETSKAEQREQRRQRLRQHARASTRSAKRRASGKMTSADRRLMAGIETVVSRHERCRVPAKDAHALLGGKAEFEALAEMMGWRLAFDGFRQEYTVDRLVDETAQKERC